MNEYEKKALEEIETQRIGRLVGFIVVISPVFGIIAGVVLHSTLAIYVVGGLCALLGVAGIVSIVKEKRERKRNEIASR